MGLAHGTFGWVDLVSPDPEAAANFYRSIFGWDSEPAQDLPYTMFFADGENVAGMGKLEQEMIDGGVTSVWSPYIIVDDIDAVVAKAVALGATPIMEVHEAGDAGRFAFVVDPVGASVGFWESGTHDGATIFNVHGALTWNELHCDDVEKAKSFYAELLGWDIETADFGELEYTVIMNRGRANGGIMQASDAANGGAAYWSTCFVTADCNAAVAAATANGGSVTMGPDDSEVGPVATLADPFGAVFTVIEPTQVDGQPPR